MKFLDALLWALVFTGSFALFEGILTLAIEGTDFVTRIKRVWSLVLVLFLSATFWIAFIVWVATNH